MLFKNLRKNKVRKHRCCRCYEKQYNEYFGIESFDEKPRGISKVKYCRWCGQIFYYKVKGDKNNG